MTFDWAKFRQSKVYDFLMGLPLIYWFGYVEAFKLRPALAAEARDLLMHPYSLLFNLRFFGLFASICFNLLTVYLIVVRTAPIRRSQGWLPRFCGVIGTFTGVGIQYLKPVQLPLGWQLLASSLIFLGCIGSFFVLNKLGKSFSIMPEARVLVTSGPYAVARHPLYAVEILNIVGASMLFIQPWATLLAIAVIALLVVRSHFEEQVLTEAYPEYAQYRARVKRFGFI